MNHERHEGGRKTRMKECAMQVSEVVTTKRFVGGECKTVSYRITFAFLTSNEFDEVVEFMKVLPIPGQSSGSFCGIDSNAVMEATVVPGSAEEASLLRLIGLDDR